MDTMINKRYDATLIQIEMIDGVKHIHYSGYSYFAEDGSATPYRWLDYTWLICPLKEAISYGISKWEIDNQESVKQYIEDLSLEGLNKFLEAEDHPIIEASKITMDTPCGMYFVI